MCSRLIETFCLLFILNLVLFVKYDDCRVAMVKAPEVRVKMEYIKSAMKWLMRLPMDPAQAEQRPRALQTREAEVVAICHKFQTPSRKKFRQAKVEMQLTLVNQR